MKFVQLDTDIFEALVKVVAQRPYGEVAGLMDALRSKMRVIDDAVESESAGQAAVQ